MSRRTRLKSFSSTTFMICNQLFSANATLCRKKLKFCTFFGEKKPQKQDTLAKFAEIFSNVKKWPILPWKLKYHFSIRPIFHVSYTYYKSLVTTIQRAALPIENVSSAEAAFTINSWRCRRLRMGNSADLWLHLHPSSLLRLLPQQPCQ
jgi:hypothetical protein